MLDGALKGRLRIEKFFPFISLDDELMKSLFDIHSERKRTMSYHSPILLLLLPFLHVH